MRAVMDEDRASGPRLEPARSAVRDHPTAESGGRQRRTACLLRVEAVRRDARRRTMIVRGRGEQDCHRARQASRTCQMANTAVAARGSGAGIAGLMLHLGAGRLRVVGMHVGGHGSRRCATFMPVIAALRCLCSIERVAAEWHRRRGPSLRRQPGDQEQDNKAGRVHGNSKGLPRDSAFDTSRRCPVPARDAAPPGRRYKRCDHSPHQCSTAHGM